MDLHPEDFIVGGPSMSDAPLPDRLAQAIHAELCLCAACDDEPNNLERAVAAALLPLIEADHRADIVRRIDERCLRLGHTPLGICGPCHDLGKDLTTDVPDIDLHERRRRALEDK